MSFLDRAALACLPLIPRFAMKKLASRYIAGETLDSAVVKLTELRSRGFQGIIDLLGEDVTDERAARAVVRTYREVADRVARERLDAYVSVKPTHLGLRISEDLCYELYAELTRRLREATRDQWRALARQHLPVLRELTTQRWRAQGELAFLLDGDLKEARGGLRDVRVLRGVGYAQVAVFTSAPSAAPRTFTATTVAMRPRMKTTTMISMSVMPRAPRLARFDTSFCSIFFIPLPP